MIYDRLFFDRLDELAENAERGSFKASGFLSPEEVYAAVGALKARDCGIYAYGGCAGTERKRIFFLPAYMTDGECGVIEVLPDESAEDVHACIAAVKITGSGYERLTHSSYMGAVLSLGLQRSAVGDIAVIDEKSAYVFCSREAADFLCGDENPLQSVGRDKVKTKYADIPADYEIVREFLRISDTIASQRLDCVVGALCGYSRDKAKSAVADGEVSLNYEQTLKADTELNSGDVVSIRGFGKFIIRNISDRTRKDRIRLIADKYK